MATSDPNRRVTTPSECHDHRQDRGQSQTVATICRVSKRDGGRFRRARAAGLAHCACRCWSPQCFVKMARRTFAREFLRKYAKRPGADELEIQRRHERRASDDGFSLATSRRRCLSPTALGDRVPSKIASTGRKKAEQKVQRPDGVWWQQNEATEPRKRPRSRSDCANRNQAMMLLPSQQRGQRSVGDG